MQQVVAQNAALAPSRPCCASGRRLAATNLAPMQRRQQQQQRRVAARGTRVDLQDLDGNMHVLDVPDGENILDVALEQNIDLPYDCRMGVCLRCSAKIEAGSVDQPGGMISEDSQQEGYALLCVSYPQSDCKVRAIPEGELVDAVMNIA